MEKYIKESLSYSLASDLHLNWCEQELQAYYQRFQDEYKKCNNPSEAYTNACFKNGEQRNEVEFDVDFLMGHESLAEEALSDYNAFKTLFNCGAIYVKRFTKRNLSEEEISRLGKDYKDGKENILKDFSGLSSESQYENLEAARVAINEAFDRSMAGEMDNQIEIERSASVIHQKWLERNPWAGEDLAVDFKELSKEEQEKDIVQIYQAYAKLRSYYENRLNIDEIVEKYGIEKGRGI